MTTAELDGWLPCRIHWTPQGPSVEWIYAGAGPLTDPFFDTTVRRLMEQPYRALFRRVTPIAVLEEHAAALPCLAPSGFIFHLSRCGSTVISRMLAASRAHVVVAEPNPVEDLIWAAAWLRGLTEDRLVGWLRALLRVLGQPRLGPETRYFVKVDPLQTIALPIFRKAFPNTPWIFVYRDPVEVLVSLTGRTPAFAIPGVPIGGFYPVAPVEAAALPPEEYAARVLHRIASSAAACLETGDGMAVNYTELPAAVTGKIGTHFGLDWTPEERAVMEQAARYNAKDPSTPFAADSRNKQQAAGPQLRAAAAKWLNEPYCRLEAIRLTGA